MRQTEETRYQIVMTTNPYIASRSYNGKTRVVVKRGFYSLDEANKALLSLYNEKYDGERPYASNWGIAVIQSNKFAFGANKTFMDGTRSFDYDSRVFQTEVESNNEEE